jgi:N-methylhydantoinase B/acetone carboxylase, alpha subunit
MYGVHERISGEFYLGNCYCALLTMLYEAEKQCACTARQESKPVFFVASRGHHADIGGITPGSMPPHSKSLIEEGASFKSFYLVRRGIFNEAELVAALKAPGMVPGSSGTRHLQDNLSDLKAQIAANHKVLSAH